MSHVSSLSELPDGRLAATWYAGSREGAGDVAIYFSTRGPADTRWSLPRAIVTRESATRDLNRYIKKVGNAVVFADSAGKLSLLYVTVSIGGWSGSSLNLTSSIDGGATWSQSQRLTLSPFFNLSELAKNAPAALIYGSWAVPIYHELISTFPEVLWLDETEKGVRVTKSRVSAGWFGYQPALTPLTASTALAVLRNDDDSKAVSVARTDDGGETWSTPNSLNLPNPDAGLDAIRLSDGRLLLAFNDSTDGTRESAARPLYRRRADVDAHCDGRRRTWRRLLVSVSDASLERRRAPGLHLEACGNQARRLQHSVAQRMAHEVRPMTHASVVELYSAVCPWLALVWCLQRVAKTAQCRHCAAGRCWL